MSPQELPLAGGHYARSGSFCWTGQGKLGQQPWECDPPHAMKNSVYSKAQSNRSTANSNQTGRPDYGEAGNWRCNISLTLYTVLTRVLFRVRGGGGRTPPKICSELLVIAFRGLGGLAIGTSPSLRLTRSVGRGMSLHLICIK